MMTLAAFAATGATERPSSEPLKEHTARIGHGITALLKMKELATGGAWTLKWVGQTASRANLAYIAQGPDNGSGPVYALVLRGTVGGSPIDTAEDMQVGLMLPFLGGAAGNISQGAMQAFTDIVMGTGLIQALQECSPILTLYVVGHSLGGAMATTMSLYIANTGIVDYTNIYPYTFAAPTAGDQAFATAFNSQFSWAVCVINAYDLVPNAWQTLASMPANSGNGQQLYYPGLFSSPKGPGPTMEKHNAIGLVISSIADGTNGNLYVQPTQQQPWLNVSDVPVLQWAYPANLTSMQEFEVQVGFQHANTTYLALLGAPSPTAKAPVVASISPPIGVAGTPVTITPPVGMIFEPGSVVDFGIVAVPCTVADDGSSISVVAPPGVGTVDIRVTNKFGTSPAVPVYPNLTMDSFSDQFTYQGY
ncbi:lipase family protein [Inquilinus ginsengisoli]|uniref:lipase family protein n=1 Tax=Inquilinus ginsengisoli TaxID=363840 RepID=UPI003D1C5208